MAETKLEIVNRGLQRIGARRLANFTENTRERLEVDAAYDAIVRQELQANLWTFAIKRAQISVDATAPAFGKSFRFAKPSDYLRLAPYSPDEALMALDLLIEGAWILSNYGGTLNLRYIYDVTTETTPEDFFHPLFANAISMRLGLELAEVLTGSDTKTERLETSYTHFVNEAKRIDAIENGPIVPEIDETVAVRISTAGDPTLRSYS